MKKCPVCEKTFEDSMRFCQVDGTELVADEPAFDPYATVVGHKLDLTPELDKPLETPVEEVLAAPVVETGIETSAEAAVEPIIHETTGSIPIAEPDEVLELPGMDPLKTMYVSEAELKEAFGTGEANETLTEESIMSEPPAPGFGEMAPPPSPFSAPESPLVDPSPYADAETVLAHDVISPFQQPEPAPVAEWNPPPAPDLAWQGQQAVANAPFQSPDGVEGQSKGMAIGALVCGILSCTILCCMGIFLGPVAFVLGLLAKKKADENPSEFGGRGLALAGMITGAIGAILGIVFIIYEVVMGGLALLLQGMPK